MKVKSITNSFLYLTQGKEYDVIAENINEYCILNDNGKKCFYAKELFEEIVSGGYWQLDKCRIYAKDLNIDGWYDQYNLAKFGCIRPIQLLNKESDFTILYENGSTKTAIWHPEETLMDKLEAMMYIGHHSRRLNDDDLYYKISAGKLSEIGIYSSYYDNQLLLVKNKSDEEILRCAEFLRSLRK